MPVIKLADGEADERGPGGAAGAQRIGAEAYEEMRRRYPIRIAPADLRAGSGRW